MDATKQTFDLVPQELKSIPQWVCWDANTGDKNRYTQAGTARAKLIQTTTRRSKSVQILRTVVLVLSSRKVISMSASI